MIDTIVFDMGRVLIHWSGTMLMEKYSLTPQEEDILNRELFGSVEWVQLDRGSLRCEEVVASVCPRVPQCLHGIVGELVNGWWLQPLRHMEGMEQLIRELKGQGYGIYLLSNAGIALRQYFHRLPGADCFDGILVSAEEKLLKPQPEIFRLLLNRFGLTAESCVFIDDAAANVEGAVFTGMQGIIFRGDAKLLRQELQALGVRY